jgi:thioredoxin-disulfide reductase
MNKYDVIIVGGAAAGLTAGLYAGRRALKSLVLTKTIGGQASLTTEIENYPGVEIIGGAVLMNQFKTQTEKFGAEIKMTEVAEIKKTESGFSVKTLDGEFESLSLILAFGLSHRKLNVPGEKELAGKGVTYCATCDGPLFRNKIVAVVGGGNSAFDAAEFLADICQKVYLIVRTDQYKAEQVLIDAVKNKANVEILNFTEIKEIVGERKVEKIKVINNQTNEEREIELNGVFIEAGYVTQTEMVKDLVALDEKGQIIIDNECKTNVVGIFAAGDVTNAPFKQVVISAGEGAKAALSANRYVKDLKGGEDKPDWQRRKK